MTTGPKPGETPEQVANRQWFAARVPVTTPLRAGPRRMALIVFVAIMALTTVLMSRASVAPGHRISVRTLSNESVLAVPAIITPETVATVSDLHRRISILTRELRAAHVALSARDAALAQTGTALRVAVSDQVMRMSTIAALTAELAAARARNTHLTERFRQYLTRLDQASAQAVSTMERAFRDAGIPFDLFQGPPRPRGLSRPATMPASLTAPLPDTADPFYPRVDAVMREMAHLTGLRDMAARLPLARPAPGARRSSAFGPRRDPLSMRTGLHRGLDLAAPRGTPVRATAPGRIIAAQWMRGYGKTVKIRHAFGFETVYAHLDQWRIRVGDRVETGQLIGDMGTTGRSTGPHLHYEIRLNGTPVDPARYIEAARHVLQEQNQRTR